MSKFNLIVVLSLALAAGCSDGGKTDAKSSFLIPAGDYVELVPRVDNVQTGAQMRIDQMASEDIIIAVNGFPLTRELFDKFMVAVASGLMKKKRANPHELNELVEQSKRNFIRDFAHKRLLIDEARRLKVTTVESVRTNISEMISTMAKNVGKTPEDVIKACAGDIKLAYYDMAERIWINSLIAARIPPKVRVDDAFVSNVQAQVEADNLAVRATNNLIRANMLVWKKDVLDGKVTFDEIIRKHSVNPEDNLDWGEFEKTEIDDRNVARAAFELPVGLVSDPIEDDNGYQMVKVVKITPAQKNDKGRVIQRELRQLQRVYVEKEPEFIRQDDKAMMKDLKRQMQYQATEEYAQNLETNGLNTVVYPHGMGFFHD